MLSGNCASPGSANASTAYDDKCLYASFFVHVVGAAAMRERQSEMNRIR